MKVTLESAINFVRTTELPPALAVEESAAVATDVSPTLLTEAKDQASVVGSDIISFVSGVTVEQRQDLINSALLAQLVAKVQVPDRTKLYDWYNAYFEVLKQIGWVIQSEQFATYQASSIGFEAHEAIIGLATTLLGAAPAALAVVKATLDALKNMKANANSPWLRIFNRESQSGQTAHFQVTLAERDDKGQFLVTLMAFGLEAKSTLTQVLFFKIHTSEDILKNYSGKISINSKILAGVRDQIEKKLVDHVNAYVKNLPDLDVPQPVSSPLQPAASLESASPLSDQLLGSVTDDMIAEAAAFREEPVPSPEARSALESTTPPSDPKSTISPAGYQFIVRWETGGQAYYEKIIKGRPEWPGYSSGITIGCGWDLGYHSLPEFQTQWSTRLSATDFQRLAPTIGFRTVEPNRAAKVTQAQALIRSLSDISVPWAVAIEQFNNVKYPDLIQQLYRALDNLDRIHPHCRAALLSLTFNRGPAFSSTAPRFAEMHEIGLAMRSGQPDDFARIPALIRSMKRIWGPSSSLAQRREGEAVLFESGLKEMQLAAQVAAHATTPPALESAASSAEALADLDLPQTDDADPAEVASILADEMLEAAGLTVASVKWNDKDDEQPDYRHLDTSFTGSTFDLHPEDLDLLIKANEFSPLDGKLVFALRGASLGGVAKRENSAFVTITDQRPDHRVPRCVIGVYDRAAKTLSAYQASTVPNAAYVFRCYQMAKAGTPIAGLTGNILPTGCYTYTVGPHHPGTSREIPTVLRLSQTVSGASAVVVLRSINDVIYDRFDRFVTATPADNIHPAQMAPSFSSAGCLTIPGFYANGRHTGSWADFRAALGLGPGSNGTQYSVMLLTGLDAALAAQIRGGVGNMAQISRLRHGSTGPKVAALQRALHLPVEARAQIGPSTRQALVALQVAKLDYADGIYGPAMDERLGLNIYASA